MIKLDFLLRLMNPADRVSVNLCALNCEEEEEIMGAAGILRLTLHPFVLACEVIQIYSEDNRLVLMTDVTTEAEKNGWFDWHGACGHGCGCGAVRTEQ